MRTLLFLWLLHCASVVMAADPVPAGASAAAACQPAALAAMQRRTPVAAYYELKLAALQGRVIEWGAGRAPRSVPLAALQVAVAGSHAYAVDSQHQLITWVAGSNQRDVLLDKTVWLAAGDSALMVIRCDGSLWRRATGAPQWSQVADAAVHAWVGDGADYYVDPAGGLYVQGKAHRGQYGDGKLAEGPGWTRVATDAVAVVAHTGHALYLRRDGAVLGTGGNRFGPLGRHGLGDKADVWGVIFDAASMIATGSRHSLVIRADRSLWVWGAEDGVAPKQVLAAVVGAAGGLHDSVALTADGALWNWLPGKPPQRLVLPP